MLKREDYIKRISSTLAQLQADISLRGYINLYDSHVLAEDFLAGLLNIVFGYNLQNLNYLHKNQPGVDLGDTVNGIAFQVTAEKTRRKIQRTINEFIEQKLYEKYPRLYFFMLHEKYDPRSSFITGENIVFGEENILDFSRLIKKIGTLDTEKLMEIVTFLDREISSIGKSTLTDLSQLEKLLIEISGIKELDYYHADFQRWHNEVKQYLRHIFGEDSYQVREYSKIAWHTSDNPVDATKQRDLFTNSCIAAEGQLSAIIAVKPTTFTDATVEFSYERISIDRVLDEHLYKLSVYVENQGSQVIHDYKLEIIFPDLRLVPKKWTIIAPEAYHSEENTKSLTEVTPEDKSVSITRQGYFIRVSYQSKSKLYPNEKLDLTEAIGLKYRVNSIVYHNLADIPPISWTLYADNMPRKQSNISISRLNDY